MGSQSIEIFRQGIWASVTGGWYYDPHQKIFSNTFHLYLWLYLSCVPFSIYLCSSSWWTAWIVHLVILTVISAVIKCANYVLHNMFDADDVHQEEVPAASSPTQADSFNPSDLMPMRSSPLVGPYEELAMQVVSNRGLENGTPPVGCSSRNSAMDADGSGTSQVAPSIIDLKVDVHHKNSSGSDEGNIGASEKAEEEKPESTENPEETELEYVDIKSWLKAMESQTDGPKEGDVKIWSPGGNPGRKQLLHSGKRAYSASEVREASVSSLKTRSRMKARSRIDGLVSENLESFQEERCSSAPEQPPLRHEIYSINSAKSKKGSKKAKRTKIKDHTTVNMDGDLLEDPLKKAKATTSKNKQRQSDADTDEEIVVKDSTSPLLTHPSRKQDSRGAGPSRKARSSRSTYHPLIQKDIKTPPTTTDIEGFRVTTLTFENIYADDESSSDNSPLKVSSDEEPRCLQVAIAGLELNPPASETPQATAEPVPERSNLSSPDIDWLFCHSESDSEFQHVEPTLVEPYTPPSPDTEQANLRDPEGLYKQGAIPKHRRQGVIISGPEPSPVCPSTTEEETMDLLRKMIDVFSKYPENHPKDFKKFLVLVSLEQGKKDESKQDKIAIAEGNEPSDPQPSTSGAIPRPSRSLQRKAALRRRRPPPETARADKDNKSEAMSPSKCSGSTYLETSEDSSPECVGRSLPAKDQLDNNRQLVHLATNHNDTTNGAVHCFQDELGHWFTYTFNNGNSGASSVTPLDTNSPLKRILMETLATAGRVSGEANSKKEEKEGSLSSSSISLCSGMTVVLDNQKTNCPPQPGVTPSLVPPYPPSTTRRGSPVPRVMYNSGPPWNDDGPPSRLPATGTDAFLNQSLVSDFQTIDPLSLRNHMNPIQLFTNVFMERRRRQRTINTLGTVPSALGSCTSHNFDDSELFRVGSKFQSKVKTVQYYNLKLFGKNRFRIRFDRLSLLSLIDRNLSILESLFSVFLIVLVGVFGGFVLSRGYYREHGVFFFCWAMSSCQYSLFKSVQPDAASPTHGYNHLIVYSRPIYFCICCSMVVLFDLALSYGKMTEFSLYGVSLTSAHHLELARDGFIYFIAFFPLLFSLGLLPQIDTFFMYLFEQIDIHFFGGNAMVSLKSSIYCVIRSVITVLLLYGFVHGAMMQSAGSQHILFSLFCGLIVSCSYHLSRSSSNPAVVWQLIQKYAWPDEWKEKELLQNKVHDNVRDPLPQKLMQTVLSRFMQDSLVCSLLGGIVFVVHSSGVFSVLLKGTFPDMLITVWILTCIVGFINHYLIPQLRTTQPCMCWSRPALKTYEYDQFEVYNCAKVMWFEKMYIWLCLFEKNILYLIVFISALTKDASTVLEKHPNIGNLMVVVCGLKCLRSTYSQPQFQYLILSFTVLFFNWDTKGASESFLVDYFFMGFIFSKFYELLLKMKFIVTYIAPWQITWGSAFHAFAQPFSVPHSAMLFLQAVISAALSTPLNPVLGSAIFITSYVRPIKFWERDYDTKRLDQSNTRLSSLLERSPGVDDNNLNSIFYEHLTRSLQHSLCGDLLMGHWGPISQGDCFVLASDNLNCLVHIIEIGNGLVTFQVRGLEFRGTYCQQREVEAISEGVEDDTGCCCCEPGHLPRMLSANAAFNQRWLAWEVTATKYVLEGYSISDNSAASMFQMFELRKILITYYVKCIIYYVVESPKLMEWMENEDIISSLEAFRKVNFVDLDPIFHHKVDEDYSSHECGITRTSFVDTYYDWIVFCVSTKLQGQEDRTFSLSSDAPIVSLCLALSLLGRRVLGPSSQCENVEVFLSYLHTLFKGDIRPTSVRDEWVFYDTELLQKVVAPALRMSLKLHQDHFMVPGEYDINEALHDAITSHRRSLVICHEGDPAWRSSILSGKPSLLSLRHVNDDGEDRFKIIMLNKRHLLFRVIKVNKECVRGLWAGQQQELIYLRNRNPERGSIQNAKQALRNIINSSCDQPIGYPIYVSPLTTSYADTHESYSKLTGGSLTPSNIKKSIIRACNRMKQRCVEGCSSGSSGFNDDCVSRQQDAYQSNNTQLQQVLPTIPMTILQPSGSEAVPRYPMVLPRAPLLSRMLPPSTSTSKVIQFGSLSRIPEESDSRPTSSLHPKSHVDPEQPLNESSWASLCTDLEATPIKPGVEAVARPMGFQIPRATQERISREMPPRIAEEDLRFFTTPFKYIYAKIIDANLVYDKLNLGRKIDVVWPDESMRARGGQSYWGNWVPVEGMEGTVVHSWSPHHHIPVFKSTMDKTILLLKITDKYVPIAKAGVQLLWGPSCESE